VASPRPALCVQDYAPIIYRVLSLLPYLIPLMGSIAFTDKAYMVGLGQSRNPLPPRQ